MRERELILLFLFIDLIALNVSLMIMGRIHYGSFFRVGDSFFLLNFCWFVTFVSFINQKMFRVRLFSEVLRYQVLRFGVYLALASFTIVIVNLDELSRSMFLGSSIIFFAFKLILSFPYNYLNKRRKRGQYYSKILVAGNGNLGKEVSSYYRKNSDLGHIIGYLSNSTSKQTDHPILGSTDEFPKIFKTNPVNELIITLPITEKQKIEKLIKEAEYNGVRPRVIADYRGMFKRKYEASLLGDLPVINIREVPLANYINRFWKRAFDIVFASLVLLIASPLLLFVALLIKIDSKGPVFYKPKRGGKGGTTFSVFKFRSMKVNDDPNYGTMSTAVNDPRITRIGKVIRKLNIDELPQFINVLKNEMSVVGPRPHRILLNEEFQQNAPNYMVRYYIKPGITGWAQANGWRGPSETPYEKKARTLHDLWYVENWTFMLDFYIIFLTIFGRKSYL